MRRIALHSLGALALLAVAEPVAAQANSVAAHRRLQQALDATTYRAVSLVIDSARAHGVPTEPLYNRAFKGSLHRTPGAKIRESVSSLAERLTTAKAALGSSSTAAEISAGADALGVGVPRETLAQIRALSPGRAVTVPLGVLTELVARNYKVPQASQMVVALLRNGATPAQLVSLSDDIDHDVDAGIAPDAAFDIRTRGVLGTLEQAIGESERAILTPPGAGGDKSGKSPASKVQRKP